MSVRGMLGTISAWSCHYMCHCFFIPFEKWRIDYVGEVHPHSSRKMAYIVVATKYLIKWAEAKAVKKNTAANSATFYMRISSQDLNVPKFWLMIGELFF